MRSFGSALLAGLALLLAASGSWSQDATILNARIAVGDGPVIQNGYIVVQQGRIVAVGPAQPPQLIGRRIDARGMTAIPGLVDGHKHINTGPYEKEQMADMIENGFTTVLSGGGPADGNLTLVQHIDSGQINGPHGIPSSRIFGFNFTPDQGREMIRAMGAQGIKFTGEMPTTPVPSATEHELELLRAMVDEGKKAGVEVMVHAVSTPAMVAATQAGARHQVHLPNKDFMSYADANYIAGTGTIVLDLISFGDPIIDVFQKDDVPRFRTGLRWPASIAGANRGDDGRATGTEGAYTLINARRIWDASHGKGLGFGSDQGYAVRDVLEHELKSLMVMFSMQDVIRIMTINTATFLNLQDQIGTIEPKKRADIVLVQGNPFQNFYELLNVAVVLKDGKVTVDKRVKRESPAESDAVGSANGATMVGTLTASVAHPDQPPVMNCSKIMNVRLPHGRIQSAAESPASSILRPASTAYDRKAEQVVVPARCEIKVQVRAGKGAAGRMQLWLPSAGWNVTILMLGDANAESMSYALARGHAVVTVSSEETHRGIQAGRDSSRTSALVHDAILSAKMLTAAYYGGSARYAYWESHSPEVGAALFEVQADPEDFDGVAIGAPEGSPASATDGTVNLSAFAARGGKLIEYHGGGTQDAPADNAVRGYETIAARSGGLEQTKTFYRLFLLSAGQKGDTYRADWIGALDEWVQRGRAPDALLTDHSPPADTPPPPPPQGVVFQPPFGVHVVCAYPMVARTTGPGAETPLDYICVSADLAAAAAGAKP